MNEFKLVEGGLIKLISFNDVTLASLGQEQAKVNEITKENVDLMGRIEELEKEVDEKESFANQFERANEKFTKENGDLNGANRIVGKGSSNKRD